MANRPVFETTEISVRGKWLRVPSFKFWGHVIITPPKWLKIARVHDEAWIESELQDPQTCLEQLRQQRPKADIFTFSQMPPGRPFEHKYHCEPDSIAVVRVEDYKAWWEGLPQETRKNVRRSERCGVRVEIKPFDDALVADLVQLNNSSEIRQGRRYTHFGKSFEQVKKDHCSFIDRSEFLCAYFEGELIGFIKLVYRGRIASLLNILADEKHRDKRCANALMKTAIERCHYKGLTHLTYGFFHHGNKRDESITLFKVRHGFEEALVPRFFVPLTLKGRLAMAVGLHRGLLGVLPNSVLTKGVALRSKWYNLYTSFTSRCSSIAERSNRNRQTGRSIPPAGSNP